MTSATTTAVEMRQDGLTPTKKDFISVVVRRSPPRLSEVPNAHLLEEILNKGKTFNENPFP